MRRGRLTGQGHSDVGQAFDSALRQELRGQELRHVYGIPLHADEKIPERAGAPAGHHPLHLHCQISQMPDDLVELRLAAAEHETALHRREPFRQRRMAQAHALGRDLSSGERDPSRLGQWPDETEGRIGRPFDVPDRGQQAGKLIRLDRRRKELDQVGRRHRTDDVHLQPGPRFQERDRALAVGHVDRPVQAVDVADPDPPGFDEHGRREIFGLHAAVADKRLPVAYAKLPRDRQLRAFGIGARDGGRYDFDRAVDLAILKQHRQLGMEPLRRNLL